jgi:coatomer protein complex subunit gamma
MQESRIFNETKLNTKKCIDLLSKIIYLLNQGEEFAPNEKTEMFFNVTKLFFSNDTKLRRLIYVFIKELKADENEIFIVTSCLSKDMTSGNDIFKANAL